MLDNLSKTPWTKNAKERAKALEEQKIYLAALTKQAQICFNDPNFIEYKSMMQRYEAEVIDSICMLNEPDPVKYAFKVRQLVDTLKAYRLLMSSVEEDNSRKVE